MIMGTVKGDGGDGDDRAGVDGDGDNGEVVVVVKVVREEVTNETK